MKHYLENRSTARNRLILLALASSLALPLPALAASVALATAPLATSTTTTVQPNVFLMMDDSGSMGWEYMPDDANNFSGKYGFASSQCNGVFYDPTITYAPPVDSTGTSYANSSFTAAWTDGYNTGAGSPNLSTGFSTSGFSAQAAFYYKYTGTLTTSAQKDYFNTGSTFYQECNSAIGSTPGSTVFTKVIVSATSGPGATDERTNFANWYSFYRNRINMMKTATGLAFQPIGTSYRVGFSTMNNNGGSKLLNPATFDAAQKSAWYTMLYSTSPGSSTPLLGALADIGKIFAHKLTSLNGVAVVDPVQYSCQQNFTILTTDGYWNSQTGDTKLDGSTAVGNQDGTAARPMYDGATVGSTYTNTYTRNNYTTSSSGCSSPKKKLKTTPQTGSCTTATSGGSCSPTSWNNGTTTTGSCVSSPYGVPTPNPTTPVLQSSVASTSGGFSNSLADVAMYYYQTDLRTTALGNCTGAIAGESVCTNNVFTSTLDNNTQQHMTTFTLGLGARGRMVYSSSYLADNTGDYVAVKLGSTASATVCTWQTAGTVCNWPTPNVSGTPENVDDLWHAAVNGRGVYFNATNPSSLSASLSNALTGINARRGAAAAAATSTLNPVAGNNFAYVASYTTVTWKGNLEARGINVDTGVVSQNASWCLESVVADTCAAPGAVVADTSGATTTYNCVTPNTVLCNGTLVGTDCYVPVATACTGTMAGKVSDLTDTRTIKTANAVGNALINFDAGYAAANPGYFNASHIGTLSQWSTLSAAQQTAAQGVNLVNYLRGQNGFEADRSTNVAANWLYRGREAVMGDALESQPAFIAKPVFGYTYPGYATFKTNNASRVGTVYMGANDGMMHAIAADTGIERWAYIPSMVIPNMWKLADKNYATLHTNYVNGSAITSDVCTANCTNDATAVWKTILVGGLNGGGRGYYALDITNPTSPTLLWEFTPSTSNGVVQIGAVQDDDVGYSFSQAIVTQKTNGTWVVLVTSGYNNTSPGTGKGFLYVLNAGTGAIISKIPTNVGSTTTPSGLAKIAGWNNEPAGNKVGYVYGGDLLGNIWRFDINSTVGATVGTGDAFKFATLLAIDGTAQPITTTPVLGEILTKRYVFISTGKYLETGDLTTTQQQTFYSIKDDNATATLVNARSALVQQTLTNATDGSATRVGSTNPVTNSSDRGCYVNYPDTGERANIDSKLVQGIVIAPTIVPSNTACSPGGYGWLNYIDYKTCGASSVKSDSTIVGVNVIYIQGVPEVQYVTSTNPTPYKPPIQPPFLPPGASFSSRHVIWHELIP